MTKHDTTPKPHASAPRKKVCICCSLSFTDEAFKVAEELTALGFEPLLPQGIIDREIQKTDFDPVAAKIATGNVNKHFDKVQESDIVLVLNYPKKGIDGYIGANTFLEIGCAHYHHKPIYALDPLPDQPYIHDELHSFGIKVLDNDLKKLKK